LIDHYARERQALTSIRTLTAEEVRQLIYDRQTLIYDQQAPDR
jgi:hypothetical protein